MQFNPCDCPTIDGSGGQTSGCRWDVLSCLRVPRSPEDPPDDPDEGQGQTLLSPEPKAVCVEQPTFSFCSPRRVVPSVERQDSYEDMDDVIEQANDYDPSDEAEKALEAERKLKLEKHRDWNVSGQPEPKPSSPPPPPLPEDGLTRSLQQVSRKQVAPIAGGCIKEDKQESVAHVRFSLDLPSSSAIPYNIPNTPVSKAARHNRNRTVALRRYQEANLLKPPTPTITIKVAQLSPRTQLTPPVNTTQLSLQRTGAFRRYQPLRTPPASPRPSITTPLRTSRTLPAITITEPISAAPSPAAITVTEQQSATPMPPAPPAVAVDNKQAAPSSSTTSIDSWSTFSQTLQHQTRTRVTKTSKWLKKRCMILTHLVAGFRPGICQETDNTSLNTTQELNALLRMGAQYRTREQLRSRSEPVFLKVKFRHAPGLSVDELLDDRNEHRRLRETRSAPGLVNGQEITGKSQPIWPSLDHLSSGLWPDGQLSHGDYQQAWADWWNWRSALDSVAYSNTLESPNNYARCSEKDYVKGKFVKQLGDVGGIKRVVTTTRAGSSASVSTGTYTSALLSTRSLPSISALLSTSTLPSTGKLPSTSKLPSIRLIASTSALSATSGLPSTSELPSTRILPSTKALPTTSNDDTAPPKSIKGKSGKHPAKGTKHANKNLSEKVLCKDPRDNDS